MIEAAIFDMDGILVDSEPFWMEAEFQAFRKVGINLTESHYLETQGLRMDEIVNIRYEESPWSGPSKEDIKKGVEQTVKKLIALQGRPLPGCIEAIKFFKEKGLKIGLCSSSSPEIIEAVLEKLNIKSQFAVIHSAENEEFGKPHPAAYLSAAKLMRLNPQNCLAIEDSVTGLNSAISAGMKTLAVPNAYSKNNPGFLAADCVLESLTLLDENVFRKIQGLQ